MRGPLLCLSDTDMNTQPHTAPPVKEYFDTIAPRYDRANTLLSFGLHHLWRQRTIRMAGIAQGAVVLDVCGGTGDLALRAAPAASASGRVCIYDFSRPMLAQARRKQTRAGQVHLVCGDIYAMAVRGESVDVVLIGFGLRNLTDMVPAIREIYRVLKRGGRLVCLEFSRPGNVWFRMLYDLYSFYIIPWAGERIAGCRAAYQYLPASIRRFPLPDQLADLLRAAGFVQVSYTLLAGGIAAIHRAEKQ